MQLSWGLLWRAGGWLWGGHHQLNGQLMLEVATLSYANLKPRVVVRTCSPSVWLGEARTLGVPGRPPQGDRNPGQPPVKRGWLKTTTTKPQINTDLLSYYDHFPLLTEWFNRRRLEFAVEKEAANISNGTGQRALPLQGTVEPHPIQEPDALLILIL